MKSTLLVIDVQNYFVVERAENLPRRIAGHIADTEYEHVLFVTFRNDPESNFHTLLNFTEATAGEELALHSDVASLASPERTFENTTYSAFKAPGLIEYLTKHQITDIDICGISLDGCVLATSFEGFDLGYKINLLTNLCSVHSAREDYEEAAKLVIKRNLAPREDRQPRN